MKKIITIMTLVSFLVLSTPIAVQAEEISLETIEEISAADLGLGEPTILPGSPIYPLKKIIEKIQEALTFRADSIIRLNLKLANKRLLEARKLMKLGKYDLALKALKNYNARIEIIKERLGKIEDSYSIIPPLKEKQKAKVQEHREVFTEDFFKHVNVLERVVGNVEDNEKAKEVINSVIEKTKDRIGEEIVNMEVENTEEILNNIIDELPGDEIGKIIYLQILNEIKRDLNNQLQQVIEKIEGDRIKKITEFIEENNLSEKKESILKRLNQTLESTQETMAELQYKIMNELPQTTKNYYNQIKQQIQERSETKDGSFNILP